MKVESWQGINGKLVHDDQKAIVVDDEQALTDPKQLLTPALIGRHD